MMATTCDKRTNIPPKKLRKKHLIAGPAGLWFQRQQEQSKQFPQLTTHSKKKHISNNVYEQNIVDLSEDRPHNKASSNKNKKTSSSKHTQNSLLVDSDSRLLRSDVAQCWDCMCLSLQRFVIPRHQHAFLFHHIQIPGNPFHSNVKDADEEVTCANGTEMEYCSYHIVRKCVSDEYTLLYEVLHPSLLRPTYATLTTEHLRRWSILPREQSGLVIPQIILQIDHVYCHGHCDWTIELVDESVMDKNSLVSHSSSGKNNIKGSILGWVEESFVKKNPAWIRPGVVLFCKNVSLAVFPSLDEDTPGDLMDTAIGGEMNEDTVGRAPIRQSSGEMAFIHDSKVDRMLLLGEDSIIYAWTEETAEEVSNDKFLYLMEMRATMFSALTDESTDEHTSNDGCSSRRHPRMVEKIQNTDRPMIDTSFSRPSTMMETDKINVQQKTLSHHAATKGPRSVASSIWINQDENNDRNLATTSPVSAVSNQTHSNIGITPHLLRNKDFSTCSAQHSSDSTKVLLETRTTPLSSIQIHGLATSVPESSDSTITRSYSETTPLISVQSIPAPSSYSKTTPLLSHQGSMSTTANKSSSSNFTRTPLLSNPGPILESTSIASAPPYLQGSIDNSSKVDMHTATPSPDQSITDQPMGQLFAHNNLHAGTYMDPDKDAQSPLQAMNDRTRNEPTGAFYSSAEEVMRDKSQHADFLLPSRPVIDSHHRYNKNELTSQHDLRRLDAVYSNPTYPENPSLVRNLSTVEQSPRVTDNSVSPPSTILPFSPSIWSNMTVDELNAFNRLFDEDIVAQSMTVIPQAQSCHHRSCITQKDPLDPNPLKRLGEMNLKGFDE